MKALGTLSIVIPAYNEAQRIGPTLERVVGWASDHLAGFEVIVVDDGSTDGTADACEGYGGEVRVVRNDRNRGKGFTVKHGVRVSRGDTVLFSDADLSTPIEEAGPLADALVRADIAIGSRGLAESNVVRHQPYYREAMGRTFNYIVRALAVPQIRDTQCGFKLFRGDVARELFPLVTIEGFAFDVELLFLALRRGYRVVEVPVTWVNDERTRVHALYDSMRMLRDVIHLRARHSRWLSRSSR